MSRRSSLVVAILLAIHLGFPCTAYCQLYFTSGSGIERTEVDGSARSVLWTTPATDFAFDPGTKTFFWGESDSLYKGVLSSPGVSTFVSNSPGQNPDMLAYDPVDDMVYWASGTGNGIYRAPASGGAPQAFVTSLNSIRDIAIDTRASQRRLYYPRDTQIWAADLDATPPVTPVALPEVFEGDISSLTVDTCGNFLYVLGKTDPHPGVPVPFIKRARLADGGSQLTIRNGTTEVGGLGNSVYFKITVDTYHRNLFWSADGQIRYAKLTNPTTAQLIAAAPNSFAGVEVDYVPYGACPGAPAAGAFNPMIIYGLFLVAACCWLVRMQGYRIFRR